MWSGPTFSVISLKVVKNVCLMHILHFEMSISASKCAIIISNIHLLMYCGINCSIGNIKIGYFFSLML